MVGVLSDSQPESGGLAGHVSDFSQKRAFES